MKMRLRSPYGSGKTCSSLFLAYGLAKDRDKIVIIDSENHSADLYAHLGNYSVVRIDPTICN
jgi:cellulose biosynthesis protein BcsQ